ncbi:TetR-like C-terminal domain-containing protein [Streptomyces sp. Rer75]|uniref:TetR-like C-terminal domain-containing protein n=1 Tax=unclassified Streptomyces TaxID=2593676 RepID=UPI0015D06988|nr:TetR-like C-terminal domain-containing protein [Streptomyces sp. Rer75]QLH20590.1 TetR/AcrR family transcriptional regulator C-terminal ligand-binding domain-containing protein [Streptomyces sp. Rer75]
MDPAPRTGNLRGDLIAWLEAAQSRATEVGEPNYRALLGEADPELLHETGAIGGAAGVELDRDIIEPACARGELGPEPLAPEVLALPLVMLRDRFFGRAIRELKDTLATYANQIQILTLRNAELETQNARLLERLRQSGDNVAFLPAFSGVTTVSRDRHMRPAKGDLILP